MTMALCGATVGLVQNELKPLYSRGTVASIWSLSAAQQRCRHRPYNEVVLAYVSAHAPARAGFCADENQWDYLAFLPDFRHHVTRYDSRITWSDALNACDFILVQRSYTNISNTPATSRVTVLNDVWAVVER